jgi:hypothetical protein
MDINGVSVLEILNKHENRERARGRLLTTENEIYLLFFFFCLISIIKRRIQFLDGYKQGVRIGNIFKKWI